MSNLMKVGVLIGIMDAKTNEHTTSVQGKGYEGGIEEEGGGVRDIDEDGRAARGAPAPLRVSAKEREMHEWTHFIVHTNRGAGTASWAAAGTRNTGSARRTTSQRWQRSQWTIALCPTRKSERRQTL